MSLKLTPISASRLLRMRRPIPASMRMRVFFVPTKMAFPLEPDASGQNPYMTTDDNERGAFSAIKKFNLSYFVLTQFIIKYKFVANFGFYNLTKEGCMFLHALGWWGDTLNPHNIFTAIGDVVFSAQERGEVGDWLIRNSVAVPRAIFTKSVDVLDARIGDLSLGRRIVPIVDDNIYPEIDIGAINDPRLQTDLDRKYVREQLEAFYSKVLLVNCDSFIAVEDFQNGHNLNEKLTLHSIRPDELINKDLRQLSRSPLPGLKCFLVPSGFVRLQ